jgi:hypothetical protein
VGHFERAFVATSHTGLCGGVISRGVWRAKWSRRLNRYRFVCYGVIVTSGEQEAPRTDGGAV